VNSRRPRPRPTLCPRAASVAEFLVPDAQHCCFLSLTPWRAITGPQQDISRGKRGRWSSGETALAAECGLDNHVNICNLRPSAHATRTLTRCKTMWPRQARASKVGEDAHHEDALWRFGPQVWTNLHTIGYTVQMSQPSHFWSGSVPEAAQPNVSKTSPQLLRYSFNVAPARRQTQTLAFQIAWTRAVALTQPCSRAIRCS
jgi:hypothetical protein